VIDTSALAASLPMAAPLATLGPDFLDAEYLIGRFGTYALLGIVLVVFIETGLLFPFLPGDSLLFTAGMLVAQDEIQVSLLWLCLALFAAAFLGDQVAYFIGHKIGPKLFNRPDSRFFKQEYIDQTYAYFDKYGGRTIILARFVPFVRTYAPVVAGVGRMRYRTFVTYNVIGAFLWGVCVTLLGYFLGGFSFVKENIEAILVGIVALSLVPVVLELLRARSKKRDPRYDEPHERARVEREDVEG
jgi:membrane-associated protein